GESQGGVDSLSFRETRARGVAQRSGKKRPRRGTMSQSVHRGRAAIAAALLAAQLVSWGSPALAAPASGGTPNVAKGQEYYEQSRFDEAIGLLKDLVDRGALQGDDLQHARELLARSY